MGRPSSFTQEMADTICGRIAEGEVLTRICREDDMPRAATVFRWLEKDAAFREQYARAREAQAHVIAERAVHEAERADDAALGRLAFDARKWFASKVAPKVYGEKVLNEHSGVDGGPITVVSGVTRERDEPDGLSGRGA